MWCASSACRVSSEHLNHKKHPMVRSVYLLHIYYSVKRVFKRLQVPLPHEASFSPNDNPYSNEGFFKLCEDCEVSHNPMSYWNEKFFRTHQHRGWLDYMGPDSTTRWIIEKSQGFTDAGLLRISESVRAYAYLVLSSQASARSRIIGNTASALTVQRDFLNNFEDIVNRRVDIQEDIKR